jgi:predicted negative regulator of RcsB-dependent stress response
MLSMFTNIKNILMGLLLAIVGFFVWKNNNDRKEAEEELQDVKDSIQEIKVETIKKVNTAEKEEMKKELETKVKVLKDKSDPSDSVEISRLEKQIEDVENDKKFNIIV